MANNLVVQLLLKTGAFSSDLKTAKGQIQNFQSGCNTASKSLTSFGQGLGINVGTLTKFGSAVGIAMAAGKEFKAVLESSQTTSDKFQGAIAGAKGVLDQFNTSLATGDFTSFKNGLWEVYETAKRVAEAMDQLTNTQMAYDYMTKVNHTQFNEAYNIFKDPNATEEMKEAAKKQMKEAVDAQYSYASSYNKIAYQGYVSQVVKAAGGDDMLAPFRVTQAQFRKAMEIDLSADPKKARQEIENEYQRFRSQLREYGKNNIVAQDNLKKKYADVIAIRAMLELMKDDELQGLSQILQGMESVKQEAIAMDKQYKRAISGEDRTPKKTTTPTSTKPKKDELKLQEGSIAALEKQITETTKLRDAQVVGTEEWVKQNDQLTELNAQLEEAKKKMDEINGTGIKKEGPEPYSMKALKDELSEATRLWDSIEVGTEKWNEQKKVVEELQARIESLERIMKWASSDELLDTLIDKAPDLTIKDYETIISILTEMRDLTPVTAEEFNELNEMINNFTEKMNSLKGVVKTTVENTTNEWETFNSAMAATSQVVSSLANTFSDSSEITAASILQMIASTLPAIGTLVGAFQALAAAEAVEAGVAATGKAVSTSKHWIEAIAAVASLGAVVASAIASAKNVGKFADGGIVGGTSYTGDRLTANVNSGEMILNRAQQANLFKQINNGGATGGQVQFHISGTDLVGVLNNNYRKQSLVR